LLIPPSQQWQNGRTPDAGSFCDSGANPLTCISLLYQSGGALFFDTVNGVTISDTAFFDNNSNSAALKTGGGGAITAFLGAGISLTNTVFKDNSGSNGFDIWIEDDNDPVKQFGTFITCNAKVTFCDGLTGRLSKSLLTRTTTATLTATV